MSTVHNLNVGCADANVIVTSTATFLVDTFGIESFTHLLPANKSLRGVFVTHQHADHYGGLKYLRDNRYSIECLFHSPYIRRHGDKSVTIEEWNEHNDHVEFFRKRGTKVYSPFRQTDWSKPYWSTDGVEFRMLGPAEHIAKSDTRELHDACLVILASLGCRKFCLTGDASDTNLQQIAEQTTNYCDDVLSASHHGSINGACLDFIKKARAKYTVVSTKSGVYENVPHPTAVQRYRDNTSVRLYRTDVDGTITWDL